MSGVTSLSDIAQLNPEIGAAIYFQGVTLYVSKTYFLGNTGFKGGAIYITTYPLEANQNVIISECYFYGNRGNVGGAINFCSDLKIIDAVIVFCIFVANIGKSK